ncbi:MAG TPA: discoidin domain-containing protein, partial [Thermomicrobiales bacterium]|nr:discoidin domain-containing protein [Thermomicrobiales bacterium]
SVDTPVTGYGYIASESGAPINCRATPSTEGAIVTVVGHGSEIALRGDPVDGWQGVVCNGSYGYVAAQFISDTAPPPPPEPAPEESAPIPEEDIDPTAPPAEAYPEGSNPWFEGNPLPVSDTWSENGGSSAWNAVDGNDGTSWVSSSGAGQATITIDLGSEYQLTGVRWRLSEPGRADSLTIQASVDGVSWVTFGTYGNRAAHTWEGVAAGMTARYVRFVADNPNGDPALGEIAEIQVWGVDATQSAPPLTRAHILPPIAATRRTRQPGPRSRWGISASQTRR